MSDYWTRFTEERVARRRLMTSAAGVSAGALALSLIGCSDSSPNESAEETTSITGEFSPSAGQPQKGGRFLDWFTTQLGWNPVSQEPEARFTGARYVWDRLLTSREGERRYNLEAAESVETPDPLTVVFKLKPEQYFHDIAPVNGRALRASDIVASQEYVVALPNAFDKVFANDFLAKAEAPDDKTVIFRLKKPAAYLFSGNMLGSGTGQRIKARTSMPNACPIVPAIRPMISEFGAKG